MRVLSEGPKAMEAQKTLDPFLAHEKTEQGWRGLTGQGEVINVRMDQGKAIPVDEVIFVHQNGKLVGKRNFVGKNIGIDDYLLHYNTAIALFKDNKCKAALKEFDAAIALADTTRARFNRGLVLLSLGKWKEGFEDYEARLSFALPALCQVVADKGIPRWQGQCIIGKQLLLVHDAGFGDTIMMLRYVPILRDMGADVKLLVPSELKSLSVQIAALGYDGDFYCPMMSLLHLLGQTIGNVPSIKYLNPDWALVDCWRRELGAASRKRIGIAWSVGKVIEGDYARSIPLEKLVNAVGKEADLFSLQIQDEWEAARLGVNVCGIKDFADVAALAHLMDKIVTVDTAAAHVAGAIGHRDVSVLLPYWSSWRWLGNPFYPEFQLCQQTMPNDWKSALVKVC